MIFHIALKTSKKAKGGKITLSVLSKVVAMTFILPNASILKKGKLPPVFITVKLFSLLFIEALRRISKKKKIPSGSLAV